MGDEHTNRDSSQVECWDVNVPVILSPPRDCYPSNLFPWLVFVLSDDLISLEVSELSSNVYKPLFPSKRTPQFVIVSFDLSLDFRDCVALNLLKVPNLLYGSHEREV